MAGRDSRRASVDQDQPRPQSQPPPQASQSQSSSPHQSKVIPPHLTSTGQRSVSLTHLLKAFAPGGSSASSTSSQPSTPGVDPAPSSTTALGAGAGAANQPGPSASPARPPPLSSPSASSTSSAAAGSLAGLLQQNAAHSSGSGHSGVHGRVLSRGRDSVVSADSSSHLTSPLRTSFGPPALAGSLKDSSVASSTNVSPRRNRVDSSRAKGKRKEGLESEPPEKLLELLSELVAGSQEGSEDEGEDGLVGRRSRGRSRRASSRSLSPSRLRQTSFPVVDEAVEDDGLIRDERDDERRRQRDVHIFAILSALPASLDTFGSPPTSTSPDPVEVWLAVETFVQGKKFRAQRDRERRDRGTFGRRGTNAEREGMEGELEDAMRDRPPSLMPSASEHASEAPTSLDAGIGDTFTSTDLVKAGFAILASCIKLKIGLSSSTENNEGLLGPGWSSREGTMAADTLVFWNAIRRFAGVDEVEKVDDEKVRERRRSPPIDPAQEHTEEGLPTWQIRSLVSVLSLLSRGGRTVYPLTGAADLLCDWAGVLFRRREVSRRHDLAKAKGEKVVVMRARDLDDPSVQGPLKDPSRKTPFIRRKTDGSESPADPDDTHPAISLLIAFHKFSCPQLSGPLVERCTGAVLFLGSITSSEDDVERVLTFIETIVTFGYVPRDWLRDVVELVARVIGFEGRNVVAELPGEESVAVDFANQPMAPLRGAILSQAKRLVNNLIRSPANQAIRCLRGILSHSADGVSVNGGSGGFIERLTEDPSVACDLPLVVGALRCLRNALEEVDQDVAFTSVFASSGQSGHDSDVQRAASATLLSMGLPVLGPQLEIVMSCGVPEFDYEVLTLVDARLAAGQAKVAAATKRWADEQAADGPAMESLQEEMAVENGEMWDVWDVTLDLMQVAAERLETWEIHILGMLDRKSVAGGWMLGSDDPSLTSAARLVASPLIPFAAIFDRLVATHEQRRTPGPTDKLTILYLEVCAFLTDELGVRLVQHCIDDHVCVPENPLWLARLNKLVRAFVYQRESPHSGSKAGLRNLAASLGRSRAPRSPCAQTRAMVMQLVLETYASVRDLEEWRDPLLEEIVIPLLQKVLSSEVDDVIAQAAMVILREVAHDELVNSLAEDAVPSVHEEGDLFDRLHLLAFTIASTTAKVEQTLPASSTRAGRALPIPAKDGPAHRAVLCLIGMFNDALETASHYAAGKCVDIYRDLLSLLSPHVHANVAQSLGELSHDLKPLTEPVPTPTRLVILQWSMRLRADQEHRVQFVRDTDVSGLAGIFQRVGPRPAPERNEQVAADSELSNGMDRGSSERRGRAGAARNIATPTEAVSSPERGVSLLRSRMPSLTRDSGKRERSPSKQRRPVVSAAEMLWRIPEQLDRTWPAEISPESSQSLVAFDHRSMHDWHEDVDSAAQPGAELPHHPAQDAGMVVLPVSEYLAALIRILRHERDWELVSYVLCYLPDQLSNKHFSCGPRAAHQIHQLRRLLCSGISRENLVDQVLLPQGIKRTDAHAVAYQLLATLIAYRSLFDKAQQDEMVAAFALGLRTVGNTAKACIHAIAMACHELQPSVRKFLGEILTSLARILSTASVSVHILELLATMGQLTPLHTNLTETEFQTIFGIAIQYISNHNQNKVDEARKRPAAAVATETEIDESAAVAGAFQQYVYLLAYYNLAVWFVSLRLAERRKYVNFIVSKLVGACHGQTKIDEATEVCLDMIARYTYANAEPRPRPSLYADTIGSALGNTVVEKSWILGNAIISVKSLARPGWAEACVRRPSGIVKMMWELENLGGSLAATELDILNMVLRHRDTILDPAVERSRVDQFLDNAGDAERIGRRRAASYSGGRSSAPLGLAMERITLETVLARSAQSTASELPASFTELVADPSFFQLQMSPYPDFPAYKAPMRIPDDPTYKRLVSSIDYVPVVDFHKISVVYVGPGQTTERDILSNTHGSKTYVRFLSALGKLVRLKGCKTYYTGGLDVENDFNGQWTYVWDDDITQIVFHVATLMPTNLATDPDSITKKALIGNDFVSIIFNDAGREYPFDTIRSQFNFLNIIIEPHTPAGMAWSAPGMTNNIEFFKVSLQRRSGLPEIGPVGNFKMVSTASLPHFVRQLSLHANIFSQIYLATVGVQTAEGRPRHRIEYVSHWRERLRQIRKIRERIRPGDAEAAMGQEGRPIDVDALSFARDFTTWTA